jgi:hypothetical protein
MLRALGISLWLAESLYQYSEHWEYFCGSLKDLIDAQNTGNIFVAG